MIVLRSDYLTVRTLQPEDKYMLANWLSDPVVLTYYEGRDNPFDIAKVEEKFYGHKNEHTPCMIEYGNKVIGYIQFYPLNNGDKKNYGYGESEFIFGMDQFIGEAEYWNRGIGKHLVKSMADYLIKQKQASRVVMDPQTWNARAINCYEKAGFKKARLLPKNEWHEGEYRDCWLMVYTA
ncbi:GNAT family N-acetyltransferase [Peribacillus deserti]|uniref:GNAT family N-acetyltransferase n=1 Tax=Peribacillus deserti TaxID=673318 RepID=A0A2N5M243_9BACI|nr:GNAT family N-acetyltransferase [Peribacillus deserti]PLT28437.1 GNAT family N-acetyltransferase [Peribacillus deserti]